MREKFYVRSLVQYGLLMIFVSGLTKDVYDLLNEVVVQCRLGPVIRIEENGSARRVFGAEFIGPHRRG